MERKYDISPVGTRNGVTINQGGDPLALVYGETRAEALETAQRIVWLLERDDADQAYAESVS